LRQLALPVQAGWGNAAEDLANILILASSLQPFSKTLDAMTLHDEFGKMLVRLFALLACFLWMARLSQGVIRKHR